MCLVKLPKGLSVGKGEMWPKHWALATLTLREVREKRRGQPRTWRSNQWVRWKETQEECDVLETKWRRVSGVRTGTEAWKHVRGSRACLNKHPNSVPGHEHLNIQTSVVCIHRCTSLSQKSLGPAVLGIQNERGFRKRMWCLHCPRGVRFNTLCSSTLMFPLQTYGN